MLRFLNSVLSVDSRPMTFPEWKWHLLFRYAERYFVLLPTANKTANRKIHILPDQDRPEKLVNCSYNSRICAADYRQFDPVCVYELVIDILSQHITAEQWLAISMFHPIFDQRRDEVRIVWSWIMREEICMYGHAQCFAYIHVLRCPTRICY